MATGCRHSDAAPQDPYCPTCGDRRPAPAWNAVRVCGFCAANARPAAIFCVQCGTKLNPIPPPVTPMPDYRTTPRTYLPPPPPAVRPGTCGADSASSAPTIQTPHSWDKEATR